MVKIRTLNQLQDALDAEYSWRLKEIADLKLSVRRIRGFSDKTLIRAGVALTYAHWEGFIKKASNVYITYLNSQRLTYREVADCYAVTSLKSRLKTIEEAKKAEATQEAFRYIKDHLDDRIHMKIGNAINTESNLGSGVFKNILISLGIEVKRYEAKFNLIDESLVKRRNKIAHGEQLDIDTADWRKLADEVLSLIKAFKTDIENQATEKGYLAA